jgi:hypothetical protein
MNATELFDNAIHELQAKRLAKQVFFAWPNLQEASLRLADYLTEVVTDADGRPLFYDCMQAAFRGYQQAGESDIQKMQGFLKGLLLHTPRLLACYVYVSIGRNRRIIWEPFLESLQEWRAQFPSDQPLLLAHEPYCEALPQAVRTLLAARIISVRDLQAIGGDLDVITTDSSDPLPSM